MQAYCVHDVLEQRILTIWSSETRIQIQQVLHVLDFKHFSIQNHIQHKYSICCLMRLGSRECVHYVPASIYYIYNRVHANETRTQRRCWHFNELGAAWCAFENTHICTIAVNTEQCCCGSAITSVYSANLAYDRDIALRCPRTVFISTIRITPRIDRHHSAPKPIRVLLTNK